MNNGITDAVKLVDALKTALGDFACDVAVCPPAIALQAVKTALAGSAIKLGAQNCHPEAKGAFTGEVSVTMLAGLTDYVIVGHSERRQIFGETDGFINRKVQAVLNSGMSPILCVGETLAENEAGQTETILARQVREGLQGISAAQMANVVIAYEPIWAIGTGRAATSADAQNRCAFIREQLRGLYAGLADEIRIQYGGSVTPANAKELLTQADIDGALVGGASLKAADFAAIVAAAA